MTTQERLAEIKYNLSNALPLAWGDASFLLSLVEELQKDLEEFVKGKWGTSRIDDMELHKLIDERREFKKEVERLQGLIPDTPSVYMVRAVRLENERDELKARCERYRGALELLEPLDFHGCVTGDCPHEVSADCTSALIEEIKRMADIKRKALNDEAQGE